MNERWKYQPFPCIDVLHWHRHRRGSESKAFMASVCMFCVESSETCNTPYSPQTDVWQYEYQRFPNFRLKPGRSSSTSSHGSLDDDRNL